MRARERRRLESRFPPSLFALYFGVLLLMSGIHIGLVTLINENTHWNTVVQILIPTLYWGLVAIGLTLFTRRQIIKTYDRPMKELAKAAEQVAHGDFSVYIPPLHTSNRHDYLDLMFLDFNKMVAELGSLETMRTDFIANVSHEIKTPLAAIQNYAQLLQNPGLTKEEQDAYTAAILSSTRRLSALVTNILKLNKLESQQITPQFESYDLCRQLSDCALAFEPVWEEKQIEFEAELEDRATIEADASLMELTEHALKLYAFSFPLCGFNIFSSAFFTALNNGAISAAISFLRTLVFQVFAVLVLPMVLDIDGIWYALVFAEAAALLVSAALLVKNRNRYHYA